MSCLLIICSEQICDLAVVLEHAYIKINLQKGTNYILGNFHYIIEKAWYEIKFVINAIFSLYFHSEVIWNKVHHMAFLLTWNYVYDKCNFSLYFHRIVIWNEFYCMPFPLQRLHI